MKIDTKREVIKQPTPSSTSPRLKTLSLTLSLPLRHHQIPNFRGAVADLAGKGNDLFHNHNNLREDLPEGVEAASHYIHRYPRIQYQVHDGKAALFGWNEGAEALEQLWRQGAFRHFEMGGRKMPLEVVGHAREHGFPLQLHAQKQLQRYRLYRYLPLNTENYEKYKTLDRMADKCQLIEQLIQSHINGFAIGVGWQYPRNRKLKVVLNDIDRIKKVTLFDTSLMAFDLVFSTNATLPDRLGLGRKTAFGFGWVIPLPE